MSYGKRLLDQAAEKAGSRYALAKLTEIDEGDLSKVASGKRDVPASWVLKLARVAGIDPTEAMEMHDLERAEKKRLRRQLSHSAVVGVVATLLIFGGTAEKGQAQSVTVTSLDDLTAYASYLLRWIRSRLSRISGEKLRFPPQTLPTLAL